jgi:DNA-binding transcriptional ArsR family regulator
VSDIYLELGLSQPLISKHLKILKEKGLLDFTRQGNRILYHFVEKDTFKTVSDCMYNINNLNQACCKEK